MNELSLNGFTLRPACREDGLAVTELIRLADIADRGESDYTLDELYMFWDREGFDLERDAWVVEDPRGQVVGYEEVHNRRAHARLEGDGYVHPDYLGMGIGTAMLRRMEARAREHIPLAEAGRQVSLRNGLSMKDPTSLELHANEGYQPLRYFWRMQIDMQAAPPAPVWPAGLELRPFVSGKHDRAVFEALEEAFRDHWGYLPWIYAEWRHFQLEREGFDPSLVFVCWSGDEIAGVSLCQDKGTNGWVGQLGVLRPWRKQGLGLALLHHTFGEFYRRGQHSVALGVDAQNPTGATRLYERAGMHVDVQYVSYEKVLRPGRPLEEPLEEAAGEAG